MMGTLYELTKIAADVEAALMENGGELTPELEALWTETSESMPTKVDSYNAVLRNLQAQADACNAEIMRLQAMKRTADNSIKAIKRHVADCMERFGIDRLDGQLCRFTLRRTSAVEVDADEALAPFAGDVEELRGKLPPYVTLTLGVNKSEVKNVMKDTPFTPIGCRMVDNINLIIK